MSATTDLQPAFPWRLRQLLVTWHGRIFGETARKGFWAIADQGVLSGSNFLTTIVVGRLCGASQLGAYALGVTLLVLLGGLQNSLILSPYTVFSNRGKEKDLARYAGSILVQQGLVTLVGMITFATAGTIVSAAGGQPGVVEVLWALVITVPFFSFREFCRRILMARLHVKTVLVLDGFVMLLQFLGFAVLYQAEMLSAATACAVVAAACAVPSLMWVLFTSHRFVICRQRVRKEFRRHWRFGRWICASQMTDIGQYYALHYLLIFTLGVATTGVYAACWSLVMIFNPLLLGVSSVLVPSAAQAHSRGGNAAVRQVIWRTTLLVSGAMAVLFTGIVVWGDLTVQTLFDGNEYAGHGTVITILAATSLISALSFPALHGLCVIERPDINFKSAVVGLVITIVATLALVNVWGMVGAAVGGLIGISVVSAWQLWAFELLSREGTREGAAP
jgi:O-antigen/teichoic acid export membrane protein